LKIELYGASWCQGCKQQKAIFDNMNLAYEYIDIDTPEGSAKAASNRVRSLPTIVVDSGDVRVVEVGCKSQKHWQDLLSAI
jgi:glutaredoxin